MKYDHHHIVIFSRDGHFVSLWDQVRAKVHNAMQLWIFVSGIRATLGIPKRYRYAHRDWPVGAIYAVPPLHLILRFWHNIGGRWCLHRLMLNKGWMTLEQEGGYYKDAKIRWPWKRA